MRGKWERKSDTLWTYRLAGAARPYGYVVQYRDTGRSDADGVHGDVELTHLRQFGLTHLFQVARSWRVPSSLVDADQGLCHLA